MFSLSNGYRVQRNDDDPDDIADHLIDRLYDDPNDDLNDGPNDDHNDDPNDDHNEKSNDETNSEIQLLITEPPSSDGGLEGNLETTDPVDICQGPKNFVSYTRNCSLFYDCNTKEDSYCPTGMWFDPNYSGDTLCQSPEVVCASDNTICDCAEKYPPPPLDPLIEDSVACLKDNRFHLTASKTNCGRFFICHNEMAYRMECRQGFHYNEKTKMCDYPEVVNCRVSIHQE